VRRGGAEGELLIRADSAFWNKKVLAYLARKGCRYSVAVTMQRIVAERIALIPEGAWQPVADYPDTGVCELAETTLGDERLVVRRVHLHVQEEQTELFAYWRHFAFVTNRGDDLHTVDREHRQHAEVELAIRGLKDQALAHFPSGRFGANGAWPVIACLAHNVQRWTGMLGVEDATPRTARTIRRWLLAIPGRLTRSARRWTWTLSPARPLALATELHRGAHPHPGASRRRLTAQPPYRSPPLRTPKGRRDSTEDPPPRESFGNLAISRTGGRLGTPGRSRQKRPATLNTTGERWIEA